MKQPLEKQRVDFERERVPELVSIVVVCHDDLDPLKELLPTISEQSYDRIEVICVLNAGDPESERLVKDYGHRVIVPSSNLWYSEGNNIGAGAAAGKYLMILNPDTELETRAVEVLASEMESRPEAGVVVPQVLDSHGRIDSIGMEFTTGGSYRNIAQGKEPLDKPRSPFEVPAFDGAAFMIRRETIRDVGFFDRTFEFFQESIDLSIRIRREGWRIFCVPAAIVYHEGGGSFEGDRSTTVLRYSIRNDLLLIGKNYSRIHLLFQFPLHLYRHVSKLSGYLLDGDLKKVKACSLGLTSGLKLFVKEFLSTERMSFEEQKEVLYIK